jgi:spermidine/putrescine transport system substrate-binding protein
MAAAGGAVALASPLLAACGTSGAKITESNQAAATDKSDVDKTLNFSNWQLYIDIDAKNTNDHPTLDQFKKQTGVTVSYTEDVNDNDTFYAKVAPQLRAGQDTGRDLFALTDWMAARMVRQNYVQKVDKTLLPNVAANLIPALKSPTWDPNRDYTAPWQSGLTGIAYNSSKVPEVKTISELLTRPDLKGHVSVLTEWRDTIGLILLDQGADPANFTSDQFNKAVATLQAAKDSGQIRTFTGNEYTKGLSDGTLYACMAWSGDVVQLQAGNSKIKFVQPEAGMMLWADNMMIPNLAQHKKNAELLMNFYYEPTIAAQLTNYVQYICPVLGAQQAMEKIDPTLVNNPLIFPSAEFLKNAHLFMGLAADLETTYTKAFQKVQGV